MPESHITYLGNKMTNWATVQIDFDVDAKTYTFELDKVNYDKFEAMHYSLIKGIQVPSRKLFAFAKKHNIYGKFSKEPNMTVSDWLDSFLKREDLIRFNRLVDGEIVTVHHVSEDVDVTGIHMDKFPIKMGIVQGKGSFKCSHTGLKTFINCPSHIYGNFECDCNQISDLAGIPTYVGGDFSMRVNKFNITEEQIRKLCKVRGDVYL